jgi:hypothetical protein
MIEGIIEIIRTTLTGIKIIMIPFSMSTNKIMALSVTALIIVTETDALDTQY